MLQYLNSFLLQRLHIPDVHSPGLFCSRDLSTGHRLHLPNPQSETFFGERAVQVRQQQPTCLPQAWRSRCIFCKGSEVPFLWRLEHAYAIGFFQTLTMLPALLCCLGQNNTLLPRTLFINSSCLFLSALPLPFSYSVSLHHFNLYT